MHLPTRGGSHGHCHESPPHGWGRNPSLVARAARRPRRRARRHGLQPQASAAAGTADPVLRALSVSCAAMLKRRPLLLLAAAVLAVACDDQDKKKADLVSKTAPSASAMPSAIASAFAAASAATSAAPPAKPARECGSDV